MLKAGKKISVIMPVYNEESSIYSNLHETATVLKGAFDQYALIYPEQRHREIQFNLDQEHLAHVSFSGVYRRLKEKNLVKEHHLKAPKHKKGRPTASYVHEIWLVDITFVSVGEGFWYLIAVIDLYSRYIVGWDLSASMTSTDVQKTVDFALLEYGFYEREDKGKSSL